MAKSKTFEQRLSGRFENMLRWEQLDALWDVVRADGESWYVYEVGHDVPETPLGGDALAAEVKTIDTFLRAQHDEEYCGIVYADKPSAPTLIKVYGPKNLGASCGSSGSKTWPRWIFSLEKPEAVGVALDDKGKPAWWKNFMFKGSK